MLCNIYIHLKTHSPFIYLNYIHVGHVIALHEWSIAVVVYSSSSCNSIMRLFICKQANWTACMTHRLPLPVGILQFDKHNPDWLYWTVSPSLVRRLVPPNRYVVVGDWACVCYNNFPMNSFKLETLRIPGSVAFKEYLIDKHLLKRPTTRTWTTTIQVQ